MSSDVIKSPPLMVVIAGPNGAGKSTFYNLALKNDPLLQNVDFINMDDYARDMAGPKGDPNDFMYAAGRRVVKRLDKTFAERKNFIYETTASGKTHLRVMEKARKLGYNVATIFIGLSDVELSHLRVQQRVSEGGHSVPPKDIEQRFPRIMKNFPDMLALSNLAAVINNSSEEPYQLMFLMAENEIYVHNKYSPWLEEALADRKTRKDIKVASAEAINQFNQDRQRFKSEIFAKKKGQSNIK